MEFNPSVKKWGTVALKIGVGAAIVVPAFVAGKAVGAIAGAGIGFIAAIKAGDFLVDYAAAKLADRALHAAQQAEEIRQQAAKAIEDAKTIKPARKTRAKKEQS